MPTYVIDAPGGGGKIPVMPNYLITYSDHKVVLRNYEGYITTYEEPETYRKHDKAACAYCQHERPEPGQSGVLGLLEGERMWIEPKGFEEVHTRGNTEAHRLQDPSKWVPFGVGAIEGTAGAPLPVLESGRDRRRPRRSTARARSRGRARASRPGRRTGSCSSRQSVWKTSRIVFHQVPGSRSGSGSCIASVSFHQRWVSGSAAIAAMSASKSSPTYSK